MSEPRRPEDFLEMVERARRGKLKLYLGFAAGVGKTYRMLQEAHALKRRGVDVVLGIVETHLRPETHALLEGLEQLPRRRLSYRGVEVEELDLDALLARRPTIAILDELAHTNAPGGQHHKRYQDVLAVLAAGINVIGALNVQHLEGLNDLLARTTGVNVRELVPDRFLREADQVVTVDLPIEELIERLRAGKIYAPDKVEWALSHFFTPENLATLRELALREVAATLERAAPGQAQSTSPRSAARSRVMVCIASHSPRAIALLRRGARMAGRLNTDWFVVYVETPREAPTRIDSAAQRQLLANTAKAKELGAEVVKLEARDPVTALLDFARASQVGQVIIGRSLQPWWKTLFGRGFTARMIAGTQGLDLHIISTDDGA